MFFNDSNLFLYLVTFLVFILLSFFVWNLVKFSWLEKTTNLLILSLPFERIPSLDTNFGTVRISQVLVIVGVYLMVILLIKRDKELLQHKIYLPSFWVLGFILLSIPSWFFIEDLKRFATTQIATFLVFGGFFLVANFTTNLWQRIKELSLVTVFVSLFGLYQWAGDLVGLPFWLTGMYFNYSKAIFGVPRIIGTALEPQYFAQMLYLPIFTFAVFLAFGVKQKIKSTALSKYTKKIDLNYVFLTIILSVFVLTISKGGFAILGLLFTSLLIYLTIFTQKFNLLKKTSLSAFTLVILTGVVGFFSQRVGSILQGVLGNALATLLGQSGSAAERGIFLAVANQLTEKYAIFGIGSGQYGVWANHLLKGSSLVSERGYLIVNNVYAEVWLEHGFASFVVFILALIYPVVKIIYFINRQFTKQSEAFLQNNQSNFQNLIIASVLLFSSLANYLQWLFFSPIFIMPIFIMLGLSYNFLKNLNDTAI